MRARALRGRLRASRLADAARLAMQGLLRPLARRGRPGPVPTAAGRRLVLVQLDGVSRHRLEGALRDGYMPFLASRLASGGHALSSSRSGAPASTPAFQAGLFYGVSPSVPGYVWFDRRTCREVRMDRADDASAVEARLARAAPGLLRGGTSYFSIFSGGASFPHFCLTGLAGDYDTGLGWLGELGPWDALASTLVHSVTAARGAMRVAHEAGAGLVDGLRWSVALGRLKHEPRFLAHRVLIGGMLRELLVQGILVDVSRGVPVVYTDLIGYDEAAHRRGPASRLALRNLAAADAALAAIFAAVEAVPELGYDVYVLSDHGHVATRPFEALAGMTLPEFVERADRGGALPRPAGVGPNRGIAGGRTLGASRSATVAAAEAGDLAHVYFLDERGPLPLDALRARHARVLSALAAHPAVGVLGARGGRAGFALVGGAALDLADPGDVARLPHPAPALAATYLSDLLSLRESGDLVVLGWRGEGRDVVAYAWEFGSHGGIAPEELEAFVVHPRGVAFDFEAVVRPSELFRYFEETYRAPPAGRERPAVARATATDRAPGARPAP